MYKKHFLNNLDNLVYPSNVKPNTLVQFANYCQAILESVIVIGGFASFI